MFLAGLCACTVGPEYQRPVTTADTVTEYRNAPASVKEVLEDGFSRWWLRMEDPRMNGYVEMLLEENLRLKEAAARIQRAWAQVEEQGGSLVPALSLSGSAARRFQPLEGISAAPAAPGPQTGTGGGRIYTTRFQAGLSTSWQLDLFGRIRRGMEAAEKRYEATRAEAEALIHSLIAELARRRVSLSTLVRRIELSEKTVENRRMILRLVERRYREGASETPAMDVYLARANLEAARERLPRLKSELAGAAHALDALLGRPPGTTSGEGLRIPLLPPPEGGPPGLPARLIDRRPDLKASELRTAAAVEGIGVAVANLYPDLSLSGDIGYQNDELEGFLSDTNLFGSLLADIMTPLFRGGSLRARIEIEKARARELAAAYARQMINALEEVETALVSERYLLRQLARLQKRLEAIRSAENQMKALYRNGLVSLVDLLDVERRRFDAEQAYLMTAQAAWDNRIALYLALGGDWMEEGPEALEPAPLPTGEGQG